MSRALGNELQQAPIITPVVQNVPSQITMNGKQKWLFKEEKKTARSDLIPTEPRYDLM